MLTVRVHDSVQADPIEPMRSGGSDRLRDAATSAAPCINEVQLMLLINPIPEVVRVLLHRTPKEGTSAEAKGWKYTRP